MICSFSTNIFISVPVSSWPQTTIQKDFFVFTIRSNFLENSFNRLSDNCNSLGLYANRTMSSAYFKRNIFRPASSIGEDLSFATNSVNPSKYRLNKRPKQESPCRTPFFNEYYSENCPSHFIRSIPFRYWYFKKRKSISDAPFLPIGSIVSHGLPYRKHWCNQ